MVRVTRWMSVRRGFRRDQKVRPRLRVIRFRLASRKALIFSVDGRRADSGTPRPCHSGPPGPTRVVGISKQSPDFEASSSRVAGAPETTARKQPHHRIR